MTAVHGFANASYDVAEGETLLTTFYVNVKGLSHSLNLSISGYITAEAHTARKKTVIMSFLRPNQQFTQIIHYNI